MYLKNIEKSQALTLTGYAFLITVLTLLLRMARMFLQRINLQKAFQSKKRKIPGRCAAGFPEQRYHQLVGHARHCVTGHCHRVTCNFGKRPALSPSQYHYFYFSGGCIVYADWARPYIAMDSKKNEKEIGAVSCTGEGNFVNS